MFDSIVLIFCDCSFDQKKTEVEEREEWILIKINILRYGRGKIALMELFIVVMGGGMVLGDIISRIIVLIQRRWPLKK